MFLERLWRIFSNKLYVNKEQRSINDIFTVLFNNYSSFSNESSFIEGHGFIVGKINNVPIYSNLNGTLYHARGFEDSETSGSWEARGQMSMVDVLPYFLEMKLILYFPVIWSNNNIDFLFTL